LLSGSDAKTLAGLTSYSYDNRDRLQTRTDPLLKK
jgi:YD repeat-containing protein